MCLILECHLNTEDIKEIEDLDKNGYKILQAPREGRNGGGIVCLHK